MFKKAYSVKNKIPTSAYNKRALNCHDPITTWYIQNFIRATLFPLHIIHQLQYSTFININT